VKIGVFAFVLILDEEIEGVLIDDDHDVR